jgi:hypothetical protein
MNNRKKQVVKKELSEINKGSEELFANDIRKIDEGIYSFMVYILQMNKLIETTGITEFTSVFKSYTLSDYECIYISLGSKYNEQFIEYKYTNQTIQKRSNAEWQMLPGFVRCKKSLVICIDRFENENVKQENRNMLEKILDTNITMIICDLDGTIQLFEYIITFILQQLATYSIHQNNVVIVNYIRFINPNHTENYLEENLSSCVYKILEKTVYNNSLYEWFGYQPNLYNIIYRYNFRIIYYMLLNVINILQKNIKNNHLSTSNMYVLFGKSLETSFLATFFKNIYDITVTDNMISFYEYNQLTS